VGLEWRRLGGRGRREGDGVAVVAGGDRLQLGSSEEAGENWITGDGWILGFDLILKSNLERPRLLIRWVLSGSIFLGSFDRPWNGVDPGPSPTTRLSPGPRQSADRRAGPN